MPSQPNSDLFSSPNLEAFDSFDFEADPQFQNGIQTVLATTDPSDQSKRDEIILQAKIFFYNKKTGSSINFYQYQQWKNEQNGLNTSTSTTSTDPTTSSTESDSQTSSESYPISYQEIVELIMSGKPIPGIKKIPDTVLGEEASSKPTAPVRRKPWEK